MGGMRVIGWVSGAGMAILGILCFPDYYYSNIAAEVVPFSLLYCWQCPFCCFKTFFGNFFKFGRKWFNYIPSLQHITLEVPWHTFVKYKKMCLKCIHFYCVCVYILQYDSANYYTHTLLSWHHIYLLLPSGLEDTGSGEGEAGGKWE